MRVELTECGDGVWSSKGQRRVRHDVQSALGKPGRGAGLGDGLKKNGSWEFSSTETPRRRCPRSSWGGTCRVCSSGSAAASQKPAAFGSR